MPNTALLQESWRRTWTNLDLDPPADLLDTLCAAYSEPHRHYHSLQHLCECLGLFSVIEHLAKNPGALELALWFHDAVYDTLSHENEADSAKWARQVLVTAGAAPDLVSAVSHLILASEHKCIPADPDERLLADIDLAILGADADRFDQYERQIRAEYGWSPLGHYLAKRAEVLKGFLARPKIYSTGVMARMFEHQARANLGQAVKASWKD